MKCIFKFKILIELSLRGKNQWRSKGHLVVEVFLHAFNRDLIYGEYLYAIPKFTNGQWLPFAYGKGSQLQ